MKKITTIIIGTFLMLSAYAQSPNKLSYQAIVRDSSKILVKNTTVGLQISIIQGSINGTATYVETHQPTTNQNGLVSVEIGSGTPSSGSFASIDWSNGPFFIKSETDVNGGTSYDISGTTELMSVPFALHATVADSIAGGVSMNESDPIFIASVASGISSQDTSNWNNQTIDTQIDSAGIADLGYVAGPHTIDTDTQIDSTGISNFGYVAGDHTLDTQIDSTGIADLGFVAGPHTIDTDTQIDSTGISNFGYVAGDHTIDTQIDSTGIANLGFVAGPKTINTDTQLDSAGIAALGYVSGPKTIDTDTQLDSNGIAAHGYVAGAHTIDTDTQIDSTGIANLGFVAGAITFEVDGSITNEIQDLQLVGNNLTITDNGTATTIDLSPYLDNTDTQLDSIDIASLGFVSGAHTIDTKLTEAEVDTYVANNGYLTTEVDGSITNEIQDLQLVGNNLTITDNGTATTIDLSPYLDNTDTQLDSADIANLGFVSGAHTIDTKLSEAEVDTYVANNGYLNTEVDGSITNEIQDLQLVGNNLTITDNGTATTIDLSPYLDNTDTQLDSADIASLGFVSGAHTVDTKLNEAEVDTYVANNGYLTTEVDGSITNEIQDLQLVGNNLTITDNGTATTIDLSSYLDNTDTQLDSADIANLGYVAGAHTVDTKLSEAEVDTYVANNGYLTTEVDGSTTNEIELPTGGSNGQVLKTDGSGNYAWVNQTVDTDTDTQLSEAQVDTYVANNGYLTAEVDGSTTNEIELPTGGTNGQVLKTDGSGNYAWVNQTVDTDTDTQLSEAEVDTYVANNGYLTTEVDGSVTNEIQVLSVSNDTIFLSNGGFVKIPASAANEIADADNDTKIQVEENADEDVIRFDVGGTEQWAMVHGRLETAIVGQSIFIGKEAGKNDDLTANKNVFIGEKSGEANTSGWENVFVGNNTGVNNTVGFQNIFIGRNAAYNNTSGSQNTIIGPDAGYNNTTGGANSFIGHFAGGQNKTGSANIAMGRFAMYENRAGNSAVAIGTEAMRYAYRNSSSFSNRNIAIGYRALMGSSDAWANTGNSNTAIGFEAGKANTTGSENVFVGRIAGSKNTTAIRNTFIGSESGYNTTTGGQNTFVGYQAGTATVDGSGNAFFGAEAGKSNTDGLNNAFFGKYSGYYSSTGDYNTYLGDQAGFNNISGSRNIFIGNSSGMNELGSNKLYIENSNISTPLIYGDFANDSLKVYGTLSVGDNYAFPSSDGTANQVMTTDGSGNVSWQNASGGSNTLDINNDPFNGFDDNGDGDIDELNSIIRFTYNGKLGIGTSAPTAKLDVQGGSVKIGDYTLPATDGTANQVMTTDGSGNVSWQNASGGGAASSDFVSFKFPEGFSSMTPVNEFLTASDYTIPAGKHLYVTKYYGPQSNAELQINNKRVAYGFMGGGGHVSESPHFVLKGGDRIRTTATYSTRGYINGFLVDSSLIDPIFHELVVSNSSSYTVPVGKVFVLISAHRSNNLTFTLYLDNISSNRIYSGAGNSATNDKLASIIEPIIIPAGKVIKSTSASVYLNGYLMDE